MKEDIKLTKRVTTIAGDYPFKEVLWLKRDSRQPHDG